MFEKEAEEWRNSLNYEIDNDTFNNIAIPCIEFGYNKGKEEVKEELEQIRSERIFFQEKCEDIEFNFYCDKIDCQFLSRNKWHYVKDGLPKEEGDYLLYLYDKDTKSTFCEVLGIARTYADSDDMHVKSMLWILDDVIAWKEIVLPELKESE